jgi:hypothetical protein
MDPLSEGELFDEPTAPLTPPSADETVTVLTLPAGAARPQVTARRVLCRSAGVTAALIALVAAGRIVRSGHSPADHQPHPLTRQRHGARPVTSRAARGHRTRPRARAIIRDKSAARAKGRVRTVAPRSVGKARRDSVPATAAVGQSASSASPSPIPSALQPTPAPRRASPGPFSYLGR